jgi:hypothetical protein
VSATASRLARAPSRNGSQPTGGRRTGGRRLTELEAEVEKWRTLSRKNEKDSKKHLSDLESERQKGMTEIERAVAQARAEARAEAAKDHTAKLVRAEVRAAAAGVLADPGDAIHLIGDLDEFTVDGEVDTKAIKRALDRLVQSKPYLSVQPGNGSAEGGARGGALPLNGDPLLNAVKDRLGIS